MVLKKLEEAMTVRHMRQALESMNPDAILVFVCSYGDYHRTQQALPVYEALEADSSYLAETAYSLSGLRLLSDEDRFEDDEEPEEVSEEPVPIIILRS